MNDMMDLLVGLDEIVVPQEIDLVNDTEQDWIDDCSEPEVEFEPETEQMHEQEMTSLSTPYEDTLIFPWRHINVGER